MTSTTRAVALAALASSKGITLDELQRHEPHVKAMSLFGKAHFLMAALKVPEGAAQVAPAVRPISLPIRMKPGER